ncbi:MAG TPA: hypothetical protein VF519_14680 [Mycobacteriales bacterium]
MRAAAAWCLLRVRTWVALVAAFVATVLASGDGKAGWTVTVAVVTFGLAFLSMRAHWLDEHPDRPDPSRSKHDRMVEDILRRHEGRHRAEPAARRGRRRTEDPVARLVREYNEQYEARRAAALKQRGGPQ